MIYEIDIKKRISEKFVQNSDKVYKLFEEASNKYDYLENSRIIRCILFLSENDIEKLKKYIEIAIYDPRDVMLWAEYENIEDLENTKRIRDFNKTFEENKLYK